MTDSFTFDPWGKSVQPVQPDSAVTTKGAAKCVLDDVRDWFERFITVVHDSDLDLLALWTVHTHLCIETYSTPRLAIDSPVPGSGKTTLLDHLNRLCVDPVMAASLSSPAMLARLIEAADPRTRTILIDEADRSLRPDNPGTADLLAILNSGYRRGGTRPVLVPGAGGAWSVNAMPTFAPVAMAGNAPKLPDDTRSRAIRVLLMPDIDGTAEGSDWELIEGDAEALREQIETWAESVRANVKATRPVLPDGVRGRDRERWGPLKRVAEADGGRWPEAVDLLAVADVERIRDERDEGITVQRPHVILLDHVREVLGIDTFIGTRELVAELIDKHPDSWGKESPYGKPLTEQRLGRMLSSHYDVTTTRLDGTRGYSRASLTPAFRRMGLETG